MQKIKEIIARLVQRGLSIDDAIDTAFELTGDAAQSERQTRVQSLNDDGLTGRYKPVFPSETTTEPSRKRRRRWSRVQYVLTANAEKRLRKAGRVDTFINSIDELRPSLADTLRAIVKAGKPVTARDLEKLAGQKPKTVESSLYGLRTMGIVVSESRE